MLHLNVKGTVGFVKILTTWGDLLRLFLFPAINTPRGNGKGLIFPLAALVGFGGSESQGAKQASPPTLNMRSGWRRKFLTPVFIYGGKF